MLAERMIRCGLRPCTGRRRRMKLIINHVGTEGWSQHAPQSIYTPVWISDVLSAAKRELSRRELQDVESNLRSAFGQEAYCWGLPGPAKSLFDRMNIGDAAIFVSGVSSSGDGDVECVAWIDYLPPYPLREASEAVWGSSHYCWMFFFRGRSLLRMPWQELLNDLEYKDDLNPRGWAWAVAASRLERRGGPSYVRDIQSKYGTSG